MSPEIRKAYVENEELNEKNYDAFKSDVYSLGMTIVDLSSISVGEKRSIKEKLDGMKKRYGVQLVEFVKKMLEFDFRNRKGVKELKILLEDLVKVVNCFFSGFFMFFLLFFEFFFEFPLKSHNF